MLNLANLNPWRERQVYLKVTNQKILKIIDGMKISMDKDTDRPTILLLSDLWGKEKSDWISHYTSRLEKHFNIVYYDSCELGNIDKTDSSQEKLHEQFINGGIERAVKSLLDKEIEPICILGFSIGGYIAWQACISGLKTPHLFAISSTRLRYTTEKPLGRTELFYGENDAHKPTSNWFEKMEITENIFPDQVHEFYRNGEIAAIICRHIIESIKPE